MYHPVFTPSPSRSTPTIPIQCVELRGAAAPSSAMAPGSPPSVHRAPPAMLILVHGDDLLVLIRGHVVLRQALGHRVRRLIGELEVLLLLRCTV